MLLAAGLSAAGVYLVTRDNGTPAAGGPGTTRATTTDTGAPPTGTTSLPAGATANQIELWNEIPRALQRSCHLAQAEHAGGLATANCNIQDPKHGQVLLHVDHFRGPRYLALTYQTHGVSGVKAAGGHPDATLTKDTGACSGVDWLGEGAWTHETGAAADGRRACYQMKGDCPLWAKLNLKPAGGPTCSLITWTFDLSNLYAVAEQQTPSHGDLSSWWRFWVHRFG
jgi:hypothetical protein